MCLVTENDVCNNIHLGIDRACAAALALPKSAQGNAYGHFSGRYLGTVTRHVVTTWQFGMSSKADFLSSECTIFCSFTFIYFMLKIVKIEEGVWIGKSMWQQLESEIEWNIG
ncbi:hypothetical protein SLEP1_g56991 [Rubroshorea leprosula]|uniref:Uncharacterized protein n=1 Tax=Rubroshorea leprosula TaxID=152421 RepID=A0AAV5MLE2_9ROSI|nr:hypothetical protein SLEP1_g56991 [Rubroshorea leprosula]